MRKLAAAQREAIRDSLARLTPTRPVAVDCYGILIRPGDTVVAYPSSDDARRGGNRYVVQSIRCTPSDRLVFTTGHCLNDKHVALAERGAAR